jgi:two-component system response regulator HydG
MSDHRSRILLVDDNLEMARTLADGLADRGYQGIAAGSGSDAIRLLSTEAFDAVVTDLRMPSVDGMEVLSVSRKLDPDRPVIVMTAYSAVDTAIESIRQGAYHYLTKPFKQDELAIFLGRALEDTRVRREANTLRIALRTKFSASNILGSSAAMQAVRDRVQRIADAPAPAIILGETGTGKGLVARALHADSRRASGPFVSINCAALPEPLLEGELFGHVKGAFTGATSDRAGLFAEANGGSLFLDEIAEMAPSLQAKLLHVLESGHVRPVGSNKERQVDVRIIAATHRNLPQSVREGRFREDLMYRLDVLAVVLPALRDHREDIPGLVKHFLQDASGRYPQSPVRRLADDALAMMSEYRWPGNVRELAHNVEKLVVLGRSETITVDDLPDTIRHPQRSPDITFQGEVIPMHEIARRYAAWAVAQTGGHRGRAAERLDLDPKTLRKLLEESES